MNGLRAGGLTNFLEGTARVSSKCVASETSSIQTGKEFRSRQRYEGELLQYPSAALPGPGGARLRAAESSRKGDEHLQLGRKLSELHLKTEKRVRKRKCYLGAAEVQKFDDSCSSSNRAFFDDESVLPRRGASSNVSVTSAPHSNSEVYDEGEIPASQGREESAECARSGNPESTSQHSDAHLLSLQVQSREEQERLAATPAHPNGLFALYGSYFCNCFVEHTWRFACPAILALLHHSLLPVAVASFTGQLVIFAGGPWVGEVMDMAPRVLAFNVLSAVQAAAMLISAGVTVYALKSGVTAGASAMSMFRQPWFLVLIVAGAVERLTGLASGVAFERDWVVQLAGPNRPLALAKANATLRRVDLFCEISGPLVFGWLLSNYSIVHCINIAVGIMVVSLPILMSLVKLTDVLSSGVLKRPRHGRSATGGPQGEKGHQDEQKVPGGFAAAAKGWKQYLAQPVLPASVAYVLLYFNAVLSPGGLMTSFLTQRGLDVSIIGVFRGACAAMGFLATFLSAPLIARLGLLKAGGAALAFQAVVLVTSIFVYLVSPPGHYVALLLFLGLVVLSRLGQWTYDVVDAQIFQTAIPASQANLVGTTEIALGSLTELIMLGVAIVMHDVSHFGSLAIVSVSSVLGAAAIYWHWLMTPNADQRRLFPNEPHFRRGMDRIEPGLQPLVPAVTGT